MLVRTLIASVCLVMVCAVAGAKPGQERKAPVQDAWNGTERMCAHGDYIYAACAGSIWRLDKDGNTTRITDGARKTWKPCHGIGFIGDKLYVAVGVSLFRMDLDGSNVEPLASEWAQMKSMTVIDDKVYIVNSETLFRVDADGKNEESLGAGFERVYYMTGHKGLLYYLEGEHLYRVNPDDSDNKFAQFRYRAEDVCARVANAADLTSLGDHVYVLAGGGVLLRVHDETGERETLSTGWNNAWACCAFNGEIYAVDGQLLWIVETE